MPFIGIFSNKKDFEFIKKESEKNKNKNITILHINNNSIDNLLNIKFDVVIINQIVNNIEDINKILANIKFLVINSDINNNLENIETNIIDYGLNQKATITASSINEENIIVCVQRNINNINNKLIEINEEKISMEKYKNKGIYNKLILYILKIIFE